MWHIFLLFYRENESKSKINSVFKCNYYFRYSIRFSYVGVVVLKENSLLLLLSLKLTSISPTKTNIHSKNKNRKRTEFTAVRG